MSRFIALKTLTLFVLVTILCTSTASAQSRIRKKSPADDKVRTVAILIYDGVELMDFTGPAEVFIVANRGNSFQVLTVAESKEPVKTMGGIRVIPDRSFEELSEADILVIPGGRSQITEKGNEWIRKVSEKTEITMSVCYGAFILADAGLLDNIEATTHHLGIKRLKSDYPKCKVIENKRFVDSGKIITTAGVTAGIDGALHVIERLLGAEEAKWTADEWMEHNKK